jgi:nucleoside-diphosphate-sugar epimerase
MKILVTGGKGFIGSKLMEKLREMGHEPVSYDIIDGQDLFDLGKLEIAIRDVHAVYHIAAEADLTRMMTLDDGRRGLIANVAATDNVAYLCAKHGRWLLFASTICVYGDVETHPVHEDKTLPNPSEIYAASKYAAEWVIRGYGKSFNLDYTLLRFATVYGPGMRAALGVYVFFKQALLGQPITVHGEGKQVRTLTYIDDLINGIVAPVANKGAALGQIFNITSAEQTSAAGMAEQIKKITDSSSPIVFIPQRKNNTLHEEVDVSKAKKLIGWEAKVSFAEGLQKTLPWMKSIVS